jgi:hypothetical protein
MRISKKTQNQITTNDCITTKYRGLIKKELNNIEKHLKAFDKIILDHSELKDEYYNLLTFIKDFKNKNY